MDDTNSRLVQAAAVTVRQDGFAAASARTIAARGQVNQALILYHFNTVTALIEAASNATVEESVQHYPDDLSRVETLSDLLEVLDASGPVVTRALRSRIRTARRRTPRP